MAQATFEIIDGPLSVRLEPGGQWLKQLNTGYQFVADGDNTRTVGAYVWIEHSEGWSAMRKTDGSQVFIEQVKDEPVDEPNNPEPEPKTTYLKTNRNVRVRQKPSLAASHLRWLDTHEVIESQSSSRTEADGYIWWEHSEGWSASQSLDGRWVFMEEVDPPNTTTTQPQTPTTEAPKVEEPTETTTTTTPNTGAPAIPTSTKKQLQAKTDVRVRAEADLSGTFIKWIPAGTVIEVNTASQVTNDGYIWYHHADGWSAWKNVSGSQVFLVEPGSIEGVALMTADGPVVSTLPRLKTLVQRMPVDIGSTHWFQYFGNNVYAYKYGTSWGYDRYAQGLHSGLDFGNNNPNIPTYTVSECTFIRNDRYGLRVKTGDYTIIYQHLTNTPNFSVGQTIPANTKIGDLDPADRLRHLHFEIRYKGAWIINPLLMMSDEMVNQITSKFKPSNPIYFYKSGAWNKWQTPLDQPVIKLGGPVIGPTAG